MTTTQTQQMSDSQLSYFYENACAVAVQAYDAGDAEKLAEADARVDALVAEMERRGLI